MAHKAVLLTLKSELWQSAQRRHDRRAAVLLTLKSELWQSRHRPLRSPHSVLLTLKSELWQSRRLRHLSFLSFCSHWNLNYGKATNLIKRGATCFAHIEIWTMAKLLAISPELGLVLLTLKSELWQSSWLYRRWSRMFCSHWNLNYGKANIIYSIWWKSFAHIEIWTMAKPRSVRRAVWERFAHIEIWTMAKPYKVLLQVPSGFAHIEIWTMAKHCQPKRNML